LTKATFHPVILAGGRGTRFWPLSRQRRAKQLLALDGTQTMIQQTVSRLLPLASLAQFWIITMSTCGVRSCANFRGFGNRRSLRNLWDATPLQPLAWLLSFC